MPETPEPTSEEAPPSISVEQIMVMVNHVNQENQKLNSWLAAHGSAPAGVAEARHEMLFEMMAEVGMLPREFVAAFELRWAQKFNASLKEMRKSMMDDEEARKSEQIRRTLLQGVPGVPLTKTKGH